MKIIDGKKIQREILEEVKSEVQKLSFQPVFCDVLVGSDPASLQYVRMKAGMAESVGMKFHSANFPDTIETAELIAELEKLNKVENMCGIIVQLPLPPRIDKQAVLDSIEPTLDVDCLGKVASAKFYAGEASLGYPTALSCMKLLDTLNIDLKNKKIVVLGQGMLVGKPVTALLRFGGLAPEIITKETEDKDKKIKEADVIISGIGKGKHITGDMIKPGVVIIDAGTSESVDGPAGGGVNIVGDVDLESVRDVAFAVSPVPGGVGPVTVAMLLQNVLTVAKSLETSLGKSLGKEK